MCKNYETTDMGRFTELVTLDVGLELGRSVVGPVEVEEEGEKGSVEGAVLRPPPDPAGAALPAGTEEVEPEENQRHSEAEAELDDLAGGDGALPPRRPSPPQTAAEVVRVHHHVDRRVGDEAHGEQRLPGADPLVANANHGGMVVHVKEGEAAPVSGQDDEKGVDELVYLGEVENVGPEEDGPPRMGGTRRETEDPGRGRHLGGGSHAATGGHEEGKEEEEDVVEGGDDADQSS